VSGGVLGVDPGSLKAGYALLDSEGEVVLAGIEPIGRLRERIAEVIAAHPVAMLALGRGTKVRAVAAALEGLGVPLTLVDEFETTREARDLYFSENPPRGWRRFIPTGMQLPPRPIDDYAAILIAKRFLARG
jgi:RNase H-fold protein (predicted Holliday junction resolvase)